MVEESLSRCNLLCCQWSRHIPPLVLLLCAAEALVWFGVVTLVLCHSCGTERCCGAGMTQVWCHPVGCLSRLSTTLLLCTLLLTSTCWPARHCNGSRSAERISNVFLHKGQHLKGDFSSCFIKAACRKMKSQTLSVIQLITLKPAKL